jgi:hypothetical protein
MQAGIQPAAVTDEPELPQVRRDAIPIGGGHHRARDEHDGLAVSLVDQAEIEAIGR